MSKKPVKRKAGRPPKGDDAMFERINIRVPRAIMGRIEGLQSERMDKPDKASIIRELLVVALKWIDAERDRQKLVKYGTLDHD